MFRLVADITELFGHSACVSGKGCPYGARRGLCRIWKPAGSDAIYAQCTDGGKEGILHCKDIKRGKGNNCKKL